MRPGYRPMPVKPLRVFADLLSVDSVAAEIKGRMSTLNSSVTFDVLVVDDDPDTREVLSEFCRTLGLAVATAEDGRAALAAVERSPSQYRVVLTDICMPGADGFE